MLFRSEVEDVMSDLNASPERPKRQLSEREIEAIRAKREEVKADSERKRTVNGTVRRRMKPL